MKKINSPKLGLAPHFRPSRTDRPSLPRTSPTCQHAAPDRRLSTHAAWPPCAGEARRASQSACPALHARAYICRAASASPPPSHFRSPLHSLARSAAATAAAHVRLRHRAPRLIGSSSPGGPSSSLNPPSRPQLRLLLAHLVLASVSREKLPLPGNISPELWPSSPEHSAPWTSPLHPPSRSPFARTNTA